MKRWQRLTVCAWVLAAIAPGARAADPAGTDAAAQVVGLFMQSCVRFAGDAAGLRAWAGQIALQPLPPQGQLAFLSGVPGVVFDASTKAGKLVLISDDTGACSAMAESADGAAVIKALEQAMQVSHVDLTLTRETDDAQEKALHHREYTAAQRGRRWQLLVGIVQGTAPGEAMLTASP